MENERNEKYGGVEVRVDEGVELCPEGTDRAEVRAHPSASSLFEVNRSQVDRSTLSASQVRLQRATQPLSLQLDWLPEGADPVLWPLALERNVSGAVVGNELHGIAVAPLVPVGDARRLMARHSLLHNFAFLNELFLSPLCQLRLCEPHLPELLAHSSGVVLQVLRRGLAHPAEVLLVPELLLGVLRHILFRSGQSCQLIVAVVRPLVHTLVLHLHDYLVLQLIISTILLRVLALLLLERRLARLVV